MKTAIPFIIIILVLLPGISNGQDIVPHPDMLTYPDLTFEPPLPDLFRTTLNNGMVLYIGEDRELPLINITILIRGGAAWEDTGKTGVASLTGSLMRDGGTTSRSPAELDEEIDFLAANISTSFGNTSGSANLNVLSKDIDRGLELLTDILRNPAFDSERFRIQRDRIRQNLARRNDQTAQIEAREWRFLLYGEDHFSTRDITIGTLESISRDDLHAFHRKFIHPGNMMLIASGDFDREAMIEKLEKVFADWPAEERWEEPVPQPEHTPQPGIYLINKSDVNQGRVSIGHLGTTMDNPDRFALQVMNGILGASQFTSRIMSRVRSDEGLAYSAGSSLGFGMHYPGTFRAFFQSRSEACAYAASIIMEEIHKIRDEPVTQDELIVEINSVLEAFPRNFASVNQTLLLYARDEFEGRDPDRWLTYRDSVRTVSAEEVQRVAREYLQPENFIILVVGNTDDILRGDPRYKISFEHMEGYPIRRVPLRDPLTLRFTEE
jgi:zinc protease